MLHAHAFILTAISVYIHSIKNREVRTVDFSLPAVRDLGGGRGADTLLLVLQREAWRSIEPWHWLFSPWALIPRGVGLLSQLVAALHVRFRVWCSVSSVCSDCPVSPHIFYRWPSSPRVVCIRHLARIGWCWRWLPCPYSFWCP